ncbi:hypothetical protein ACS0PU_012986 [Formica fusca]
MLQCNEASIRGNPNNRSNPFETHQNMQSRIWIGIIWIAAESDGICWDKSPSLEGVAENGMECSFPG